MQHINSDRIDLRSDTITQPTSGMREAMSNAMVGDDVLGDDPTVTELQDRIASLFGKESALFVPSGTMSNAIAIRAQTNPGDEIVTERYSHIYIYEGAGYAALSGCSVALVSAERGIMQPLDVEKAIRKSHGSLGHYPNGSLVCVENTSNRGGGTVYPLERIDSICDAAHSRDCAVHLDGARIFNASVASGATVKRIAKHFDSISVCLSKGLGAPVGSVLVSDFKTISSAHRWRKMFGGGMRQAGIIAAAGLYALDNHVERLELDHDNARILARSINEMPLFDVDLEGVETNMVYIETNGRDSNQVVKELSELGVDVLSIDQTTIRIVTHLHISSDDLPRIITAFGSIS